MIKAVPSSISAHWIQRLSAYSTVYVGLSGGLDSTVLLHVLTQYPEIRPRLIALHVHHGLSIHADCWEKQCEAMCEELGIPFLSKHVACKSGSNQEEQAREARYRLFDTYVKQGEALVLGHHQKDQAETLLLNLVRGTGIEGLCGIWEERIHRGYPILRPFLSFPKEKLQSYAVHHGLNWVEDESNACVKHERNYIRHHVLPHLETRWPQVIKKISEVARHAQYAEQNLYELASLDCPDLSSPILNYGMLSLSTHRLNNVLWHWLKHHDVNPLNQNTVNRITKELIMNPASTGLKMKYHQYEIHDYKQCLYLRPKATILPPFSAAWRDFPAPFSLPHDLGRLIVKSSPTGFNMPQGAEIQVKLRSGGEQFFWRGQTKSLKKLWQAWSVPVWERDKTPLIYVNGDLAVVVGRAISDHYYVSSIDPALQIMWER